MSTPIKILLLEDSPSDAEHIKKTLKKDGIDFIAKRVANKPHFIEALDTFKPDIILTDYKINDFSGREALIIINQSYQHIPMMMVSHAVDDATVIWLLKNGLKDYVLKEKLIRLAPSVLRTIEEEKNKRKQAETELMLRDRERRLLEAQRIGHIGDWEYDLQTNEIHCSDEVFSIYERPKALGAPTPKGLLKLHDSQSAAILLKKKREVIKTKSRKNFEIKAQLPSGKISYFYVISEPEINENGKVITLHGIIQDVTERKEQENKILRLNHLYAMLSEINSLIVHSTHASELLQNTCEIIAKSGGFSAVRIDLINSVTGILTPAHFAGRDVGTNRQQGASIHDLSQCGNGFAAQSIQKKQTIVSHLTAKEALTQQKNGHANNETCQRSQITLPLTTDDQVIGALSILAKEPDFFDSEEQELLNTLAHDISFALTYLNQIDRINTLAYYNSITKLPNRTLFSEQLKNKLLQTPKPVKGAIVLIRIERLNNINNTLGRDVGDALLQVVAKQLEDAIGHKGLVGHLESRQFVFALFTSNQHTNIPEQIEEIVKHRFRHAMQVNNRMLHFSIRCGISLYPDDSMDSVQLLNHAEKALNLTELNNERLMYYTQDMDQRIAKSLAIESKLREAVEKEQFIIHYQPKYKTGSRQITGFEALLRLKHADGTLLMPNEFISVLEETGLILRVGEWVIQQILKDYNSWCNKGLSPPRIAVNVSSLQLEQNHFVEQVSGLLQRFTPNRNALDIEITETMLMQNHEESIKKLNELRNLGCRVFLDDFGTGYSSLSYLYALPLDAIKIDRSFIIRLPESPDVLAIVYNTIIIAHQLKFMVIAEGVDNVSQENLLKLLKCDEIQGFLYSKPVAASEVPRLLKSQ